MFTIIISIVISILGIVLFFKVWGMCNDVRDLKNQLCDKKEFSSENNACDLQEHENQPTKEVQTFSKGQKVVLKITGTQFVVDDVLEENGETRYYSNKFGCSYKANEIEDSAKFQEKKVRTKTEPAVDSELCEDTCDDVNIDVSTFNFKVGDIVINKKNGKKVKIKEINANGIARCAEDNGIGHFIREIECYLSSLESIDTNN